MPLMLSSYLLRFGTQMPVVPTIDVELKTGKN